jgi:thiol:disulfide interchange protein DsbD
LLLNLMPCVFPVLSLKVLGFVEQAHHDARRIRLHGWAFAAGVVVSFWALAVTLLLLRAGGQQLGWGFQLQSPMFLVLLCALLFVLALSLSGVFEVGLWMTTLGGGANASRGYMGSVATGALATVVATPCTAPFMGPALGFALTQTAPVSLAVFTALAVGMASPYVLLAHFPAALSRLPRPGAWMETVRQFTAFPLYATVLRLLYVFSRQTSADAAWRLMIGLLLLALAAWGWGVIQRAGKRGWLSNALVAATAACALLVGVSAASLPIDLASHDASAGRAEEGFWGSWSPERVAALQADGRPVFVNFTADWCLSCQVNERTVFSTAGVRELFQTYDVRALKADWTNKDDRIAKTLAAFGRDGVPLYVFYPAGGDAEPQILPQLPTESALRAAFASSSERVQKTSPLPNEPRKG